MKSVIINLPTEKTPGPDGYTEELYQTLQESPASVLVELFTNI